MNRRILNVIMFVAAVIGTALLVIGIMAVSDGDSSGWRGVIGGVLALTLAMMTAMRARRQRP